MTENRPDPDALLERAKAEESASLRGRLKIFLGYAAGVGKTYSMLQAARVQREAGVDVVAAVVETHGRAETEALMQGLETIPRREVVYREVRLREMDLDAVRSRSPKLALVDELAHTNVPGSRHLKRWQDVEELLAAGIDVYTTLNIQHLDSLRDVVARITGIIVRETIPDRILDGAGEVELVDLPPPELLQRLRQGKVYVPEQAGRALQRFFRVGNLIALRELALRRTASRVDEEMRVYMASRAISGPWAAAERLVVCVSGSPYSERLIRASRRLADELRSEWHAVYVDAPGADHLAAENREYVWRDLRLAESLGARVATVAAEGTVQGILEYARTHNVTKIVVGKSAHVGWRRLLGWTLVDRLLRESRSIDVVAVDLSTERNREPRRTSAFRKVPRFAYAYALALVGVATMLCGVFHLFLSPTNLVMLYLLAVVLAALRLGLRPAIVTALAGVVAFDFFFVPPPYTLAVNDTEYFITFAGLFMVGVVVSTLVARARSQAEAIRVREEQTASLYALSRDLAAASDKDAVTSALIRHIGQALSAKVMLLAWEESALTVLGTSPGLELDGKEEAVARWACQNGQPAGAGTDTLGSAALHYLPLRGTRGVLGVLALQLQGEMRVLPPDKASLLEAYTHQAAAALERIALARRAAQNRILEEADKLHRAIMSSISHDLRTPLVTITGALSSLREEGDLLSEISRRELVEGAWEEAGRLNQFMANLLDMSRLEAGMLHTRIEPADVQDLVGATLASLGCRLKGRPVHLDIPPDLPLVPMDFVLMKQVLVNLLDNAEKYAPPESPVEVSARIQFDSLEIRVMDRGPGIPPQDLERVFEKFYRARRPDDVTGTGLGLAISRGIVEAHGGTIRAENQPGGGACVAFTLPLRTAGTNFPAEPYVEDKYD